LDNKLHISNLKTTSRPVQPNTTSCRHETSLFQLIRLRPECWVYCRRCRWSLQ